MLRTSRSLRDKVRLHRERLRAQGMRPVQIWVPDVRAHSRNPAQLMLTSANYGYMWWIPPQTDPAHGGAFEAAGIFGQYLYINRRERLVIVVLSARSKPEPRSELDDEAFFSAVATALH